MQRRLPHTLALAGLLLVTGCFSQASCPSMEITPPSDLTDVSPLPLAGTPQDVVDAAKFYETAAPQPPSGYYNRPFLFIDHMPTHAELIQLDLVHRRGLMLALFDGAPSYGLNERNALIVETADTGPDGLQLVEEIATRLGASVSLYSSTITNPPLDKFGGPGIYRLEMCASLLHGQQAWLLDWIMQNYPDTVLLTTISPDPVRQPVFGHEEGWGYDF